MMQGEILGYGIVSVMLNIGRLHIMGLKEEKKLYFNQTTWSHLE
jgi:hypothetical protein